MISRNVRKKDLKLVLAIFLISAGDIVSAEGGSDVSDRDMTAFCRHEEKERTQGAADSPDAGHRNYPDD